MFDSEELEKIKKIYEKWAGGPLKEWQNRVLERKKEFYTESGIPIKKIFTPEDIREMDYVRDLGFPGQYPFTRGIHQAMYRKKVWTSRPYGLAPSYWAAVAMKP